MKISAIIPTKNEPGIDKVIYEIKRVFKNAEIIVVDKSSDDTPLRAKKAGARVIYQKSSGYGGAYLTGFKHVSGDIILMIDGDMSYDPRQFKELIKPVLNDEADLVIGNRFAGMKSGAMSLVNKIGNKYLTWLLNKTYGVDIQDSQSGMRVISRKALEKLSLEERGMSLASEMLIEAVKKGLRIAEKPISYRPRVGKAKQSVSNGFRIMGTTLRLIRDYNPLLTFSLLSLAMFIPGLIIGISIVTEWLKTGVIVRLASVVLSSMLIITSLFIFFVGLMIDLVAKELRKK